MTKGPELSWRLRWAAYGAASALLLLFVTWSLTSLIRSPQDALADAAPPPPSQITYPVERRTLDADVLATARVVSAGVLSGHLPVDQRTTAEKATRILVVLPTERVAGRIDTIAADGEFRVRLPKRVDPALVGATVRVRFELLDTAEAVLVVPISALFTAADGDVAVVVVDQNGDQRQVPITMGLSSGGFVQIIPEGDQVREGDHVLVSQPES